MFDNFILLTTLIDARHCRVSIHFGNLFNGNRELGDTTNSFFNENWRDILKEIKPAVASAVADIYETLINNVFSSIPYDDMFLS